MDFVHTLSEEEIIEALKAGRNRADEILSRSTEDPSYLKTAYGAVLKGVDHAEDNFSLEGYRKKDELYKEKGNPLTERNIRALFLSAVKAVECLREIEPCLKPEGKSTLIDTGRGLDRYIKLIKAANVFRTDGQSDEPAYDILNIIHAYHGASPGVAAQ